MNSPNKKSSFVGTEQRKSLSPISFFFLVVVRNFFVRDSSAPFCADGSSSGGQRNVGLTFRRPLLRNEGMKSGMKNGMLSWRLLCRVASVFLFRNDSNKLFSSCFGGTGLPSMSFNGGRCPDKENPAPVPDDSIHNCCCLLLSMRD